MLTRFNLAVDDNKRCIYNARDELIVNAQLKQHIAKKRDNIGYAAARFAVFRAYRCPHENCLIAVKVLNTKLTNTFDSKGKLVYACEPTLLSDTNEYKINDKKKSTKLIITN